VDPAALDRLLEMTGGDLEFLDELIQTYLDDAVMQLEGMRAAAGTDAPEELVRPTHSLKGNSANIGAEHLAELCRQLEADARGGAVEHATERVAAAAAEFEQVRTELAALRAPK
jgi:HPt (histidine-containing phosphotransfer) domain-containing protein